MRPTNNSTRISRPTVELKLDANPGPELDTRVDPNRNAVRDHQSIAAARPVLSVQVAISRRGIPAARSISRWARVALSRVNAVKHVTIRIVGRAEGRRLNRRFRQRDYATNVLAFAYDQESGDLVLCAPVVAAEARAAGKALRAHYAHLVIHGVLHLQGYDHLRAADARKMEARERTLLAELGYPDPYGDE